MTEENLQSIPETQASISDKNPDQKVLIVRLSAHGDVIQTLPLLNALKEQDPDCTIGWLTETSASELLKNHPLIDHLHISERKKWLKTPSFQSFQQFNSLINDIKSQQYDVAIDVQGLLKSAIWPFLCEVPIRWGNAKARENASIFYTNTLSPHHITDKNTPAVLRYTEFANALCLQSNLQSNQQPKQTWPMPEAEKATAVSKIRFPLPVTPDLAEAKTDFLTKFDINKPIIAVAPATMWQSKHWPKIHWIKLLELMTKESSMQVVLLGSQADSAYNNDIVGGLSNRIVDLTGKTSLRDLYTLMPQFNIFIGSDSFLLHMADAVSNNHSKPQIIGLYGATSPDRTGPTGCQHSTVVANISCHPCFKRICPLGTTPTGNIKCMEALSPELIFEKTKQALSAQEVLSQ